MKRLPVVILFMLMSVLALAQKGPSFNVLPNPVCVGQPVSIINTTTGNYESYYWSFCASNPLDLPTVEQVTLNPNPFFQPVFIALAQQNNNYFAFVVNHNNTVPTPGNGYITRIAFGQNILNPDPQVTNITGLLPKYPEGIQIVNDNNNWYAFVVGGKTEFEVNNAFFRRLNFGDSLANQPTMTELSTGNQLFFPHDLYIFKDEATNDWWGLTVNLGNSSHQDTIDGSITRFYFGNNLETNNPGVQNLGHFNKLKDPVGIFPIKQNDKWYVFVTDRHAGLVRFNFGNSLINPPTATSISTGGVITRPRDISLLRFCNKILGFVVDGEQANNSNLVRLDFGENIESIPTAEKLTQLGNAFNFPHSISDLIRAEDQTFALVTNVGFNNITRVFFPSCEDEIPAQFYQTNQNPTPVVYNSPGVYNIELIVNLGLPDQANYCKEVVVNLPTAEFELVNDTICNGNPALIRVHFTGFPPWNFTYTNGQQTWQMPPTDINPYLLYVSPTESTTYSLISISDCICSGQPEGNPVHIHVKPKDDAGFSYPSATFCRNSPPVLPTVNLQGGTFSANSPNLSINPVTGQITPSASAEGSYEVTYTINLVCLNSHTIQINIFDEVLAHFNYEQSGFCRNGVNPVPVFGPNSHPGEFSATPAGLVVDPMSGTIILQESQPGTYWVYNEIPEDAGCPYEIDSTQVVIYHLPVADFVSDIVCLGVPTTLTETSSIAEGTITQWLWYFNNNLIGQGQQVQYTFPAEGSHDVQLVVVSDHNCITDTILQVFVMELPPINLVRRIPPENLLMSPNGDTLYACVYNSVVLDAGDPNNPHRIFEWSVGAQSDTLVVGALGIGYELQYHHVTVTDTVTGCVSSGSIFIEFSIVPCEIGISELGLHTNIRVYPNPAKDLLTIEIENASQVSQLELINVFGQVLYEMHIGHRNEELKINIPLKHYAAGLYFVKITGNELSKTYKVIINPRGE